MTWQNSPEYLQLFSNDGPVTIRVKFSGKVDSSRSIATLNMHWEELERIIDPETGAPYQYMCFDSYRCPITRFEIDPVKNLISIIAGPVELPSP